MGRLTLAVLAVLALLTQGCAVLGPAAIRGGRAAYNDAIVATNNEQVLAMIVRMRYGEPAGLLAVSSITASMRFQATIGAQWGVGPESSYAGNLVPLSAGAAYEESPTISYVPVQGEAYLRQVLSPLPLDLTLLLLGAMHESPGVTTLLLRSVNGFQNPAALMDAGAEPDPRFAHFAELLAGLGRGGHLTWAEEPGEQRSFVLAIRGEGPAYEQQLGEMFSALGFAAPRLENVIRLPVTLGAGMPERPAIHFAPRSLYELLNIAAASTDVPPEHLESGLAHPLPPGGPALSCIHIRRSASRPGEAMTAVRHHGWWYFIDGTDAASKETFRILESIISVEMAETIKGPAPLLTLPVSR